MMRAVVVFPGAALARKNVAVSDAVLGDRIAQGGLDVLLTQHIVERLRTILSGYDLIHGGGGRLADSLQNTPGSG